MNAESKTATESASWATRLRCSKTAETAPLDRLATMSSAGAPWLVDYGLDPARGGAWRDALATRGWSMWRYRELLPPVAEATRVDLGEGATPLVPTRRLFDGDFEVLVKQEAGNPTGSFKDRGLSLAVNRARALGVPGVQLASAGNAALALSAYAAAAGLPARVALPEDTPGVIVERCRDYGAEVLTSPGTLVDAAGRLAEFHDGFFNVSTFREPYRVEGKKTMGLEVAEQLGWELPDWIVYPTGGGTGIVAMAKAFDELEALGLAGGRRPRFAVVQMAGCAPLVRAFERGLDAAPTWEDARTRVWGLRVPRSLADFLILAALRDTRGVAVAVDEGRVDEARRRAASAEGLLCGPEGAACLLAVEELARRGEIRAGERVVVFQTGHPGNYARA